MIPRSYLHPRTKRVSPRYLFRGKKARITRVAQASMDATGDLWRGILPHVVIHPIFEDEDQKTVPDDWMGENMQGGWTIWNVHYENGIYPAYLFERDDDAALFRLFWGREEVKPMRSLTAGQGSWVQWEVAASQR